MIEGIPIERSTTVQPMQILAEYRTTKKLQMASLLVGGASWARGL